METEESKVRLNKYLAQCGVCSRRDADKMISEGRVLVNGSKAAPGYRVSSGDVIEVSGKRLHGPETKTVLAYYKPPGVTCTERDRFAENKITDVFKYPVRLTYAGRLDKDSEGLMLMTNDGALIEHLMRGANGHQKEYRVRVNKEVTQDFLRTMEQGVYLKELGVTTKPCKLEKTGRYTFQIILTQGLNRQIRRMCRECGYEAKALKRIRIMNIEIGSLKPGEYRQITGKELAALYQGVGLCVKLRE